MPNPNTDFTAGAVLTAAQQNRFPRGQMGYVALTGGLAGISGAATDIPGTSITFTAVANRLYKATWHVYGYKNASGLDVSIVYFTNAANTVLSDLVVSSPSGNYAVNLSASHVFTVAAGSVTYKLRAASFSGTLSLTAGSTSPLVLVIEDVGPA